MTLENLIGNNFLRNKIGNKQDNIVEKNEV